QSKRILPGGSSAGPAADRSAVETKIAAAAAIETLRHALATGLDHLADGLVAADAGDADTVAGVLALAHRHRHVAGADRHAVHRAAAAAHAVGHRAAEVLQHGAGNFILAAAGDLHAAVALFHPHGATG